MYQEIIFDFVLDAISKAKPEFLIPQKVQVAGNILQIEKSEIDLDSFKKVYVVGAGKASGNMAKEIELILGNRIDSGVVGVKYGHKAGCKIIEEIEAAHPTPDNKSLKVGKKISNICTEATKEDLVIFLFSGGGSSLMESLPEDIPLEDFQKFNSLLLHSGLPIQDINALRKSISRVKAGKLAEMAFPAKCITLIISDVIGNDPADIASGPTTKSETDYKFCLDLLKENKLLSKTPDSIVSFMKDRFSTKPAVSPIFNNNIILGSNIDAINTLVKTAEINKLNPIVIGSDISGDVETVSKFFIDKIISVKKLAGNSNKPICLIGGGEPTVNVKGNGIGGRNTHFALVMMIEMIKLNLEFSFASVGTDGTDGSTDAAGAFISHNTKFKILQKRIDPTNYYKNFDSYNFFNDVGGLIKTGPTGTNVMD
ncbi:MAG: DUF4147 domain-containing protein [Melioribacteraceae bacterium]|nr:DUF4147 domain-containing protein [Melioribacteraceae bacterium]